MNAVDFLVQEHRTAKSKFQDIEQADAPERAGLWLRLQPELKVHEQIENQCVYGPLTTDARGRDETLATFLEHQNKDVQEVEKIIAGINSVDPAGDEWLQRVQHLMTTLEDHIREEEQEAFPRIPRVWDEARLERSGEQMAVMKQQGLQQQAAQPQPISPTSTMSSTATSPTMPRTR